MPTTEVKLRRRPSSSAPTSGTLSSSKHIRSGSYVDRIVSSTNVTPPSEPPPTYHTHPPSRTTGERYRPEATGRESHNTSRIHASQRSSGTGTHGSSRHPTGAEDKPSASLGNRPGRYQRPVYMHEARLQIPYASGSAPFQSHVPRVSRRTEVSLSMQESSTSRTPQHSHRAPSRRDGEPPMSNEPALSQPPPYMTIDPSQFKSVAPPTARSILNTEEDVRMASRQPQIETLDAQDRQQQEAWAQRMIQRFGGCPENYEWERRKGGYQCQRGGHAVTDELLAEGKRGIMACRTRKWDDREGPYYEHPVRALLWVHYDGSGRYFKGSGGNESCKERRI